MALSLILPMTNGAVLRALRWAQGDPVEALIHCKLAVQQGEALLALRVVKVGTEYRARWGNGARAQASRTRSANPPARSQ